MKRSSKQCGGDVGIPADFGKPDEDGRVRCPGCAAMVKPRPFALVPGRLQIPLHYARRNPL